MSILNNFKKALGFSGSVSENDIDDELLPYDDSPQRTPYINPFKKDPQPTPEAVPVMPSAPTQPTTTEKPMQVKYEIPDNFLSSIIELINANLPQIVKDCIDIEAEKKALSMTFGSHFQKTLEDVHHAAFNEAKTMWDTERKALTAKITSAVAAAEESAKRAEDARQKMQIEETKRRTIAERANDLEARIATLEAEHEQYIIENKSLQNKMKVMQVYADDAKAYKAEVDQRDATIKDLKAQLEESHKLIEESRKEIDDAHADALAAKADADAAKATANDANAEIDSLKLDLEIANDENEKAKIALEAKEKEIASIAKELEEANENLKIAHELEKQLEEVDNFKNKKNNEIKSLKERLQELQAINENIAAQVHSAGDENQSLKSQLQALKAENDAAVKRISDERDAAILRLSEERATAIKSLTDAKDAEIKSLTDALNAEKENAEKERKSLAAELDEERKGRKNDVNFYEQKIKFISADQKRIEKELNDEIKQLKERKSTLVLDTDIEPDMRTAVAHTFGFDSSIAGDDAAKIDSSDSEPKIPNDIFENDAFSDDNIDATFIADKPTSDEADDSMHESSPTQAPEPLESTIEELDDIDWLMPTPPNPPKVEVPEPESAPAKESAKHEADKQQMSLF